MKFLALLSLVLFTVSCSVIQNVDEPRIIQDLPDISYLADSLTKAGTKASKWAVDDSAIIYASETEIDWHKELEPLRKSNVNHLRYRDTYSVSDTMIGKERIVKFHALSSAQEVQRMELKMKGGQIIYYLIERSRNNIFSDSEMRFEFTSSHYELSLSQSITGIFSNTQFVYGTLINEGDLWRGQFTLKERTVPVQLFFSQEENLPSLSIKNGEERIGFNQIESSGDTITFGSDYFNSFFKLKLTSDSTLEGYWVNAKRDQSRSIPFSAKRNVQHRFRATSTPQKDLSGTHLALFYDIKGNVQDSTVLQLKQTNHLVTGSFLTETGDYRFLEGVLRGDSLLLSTMDGTHVYYFEATLKDDELRGSFFAGPTSSYPWSARRASGYELRSPDAITTHIDSIPFDFSFPVASGQLVSLSDKRFENKPVIVSVMGTWCSNCMDETAFLKEAYDAYHNRGLEIVALNFELISDSAQAFENMARHKKGSGIEYPVLLAGLSSNKRIANQALPALSGVYSFPTMILMDRNHEIVKIHTGFNGPATGVERYDAFRVEYLGLIERLVSARQAL